MRIHSIAAAFIAALALILAGCGDTGDTTAGPTAQTGQPIPDSAEQADHNQADVEFAQGMIPHHVQALHTARMASTRAEASEIKDLAARIEAAQAPEIETMARWLEQWGAEVPSTTDPDRGRSDADHGMDQGAHGMMSAEQMTGLGDASGADFDRMFLEMMIKHHEGAALMARDVIDNGRSPAVIALAEEIIRTQEAEIEEMLALLPQG